MTDRDSSKYQLIRPVKSWVLVNPSIGCGFDCAYCNGHRNRVEQKKSPEETLLEIKKSGDIHKDHNPILLYGYSDPFLPQNSGSLIRILKGLDQEGWKNRISLISKIHPGDEALDALAEIENLRLGVFVTYANLIPGIESVSYQRRLDLMESLHKREMPVVSYISPLVRQWIPHRGLEKLAHDIKGKVDAVAVSGLCLTPRIISDLKKREVIIPYTPTQGKKYLDENLLKEATKIIESTTKLPVFPNASSAMSHLFK